MAVPADDVVVLAFAEDDVAAGHAEDVVVAGFAVHLVGDWVRRDLLVPGPRGYALRPDTDPSLPASLRQLWARRVEEVRRRNRARIARERGCCKITLEVQMKNTAARRIYQSFGFKASFLDPEAGEQLSLTKTLSPPEDAASGNGDGRDVIQSSKA